MNGTCFIISPFGDNFDEYYDKIFRPAVEKSGLKAIRADEIYGTSAIISDIFNQIMSAVLVLCDVTGKNPNVNYELGVAHALGKPAIIITQSINDVPFDYKHLRVISYDLKHVDWAKELESAITKTVLSVLNDPKRALAWSIEHAETPSCSETKDIFQEIVISYSTNPSIAVLRFRDQFVILEARVGDVHPGFRTFFEEIYEDVQKIQSEVSEQELVQLRKIWHDDKHGSISIWIDLIHNKGIEPTFSLQQLKERLHDGYAWYSHQGIFVNARIIEEHIWLDSFFANSPSFYTELEL
ncbi:MAG: hypothetical protein ABFD50_02735 [Smithella sp.]